MPPVTLTKPQPPMRSRIWRLLSDGDWWTRKQLADALKLSVKQLDNDYLTALTKAGYLDIKNTPPRQAHRWRVIKRSDDAPRFDAKYKEITDSSKAEAVWRAVRILRNFTLKQLTIHVSDYASPTYVKQYLDGLTAAEYLIKSCEAPGNPSYRLVLVTGSKAPEVLLVREVFDPNCDAIVSREVPNAER